MNPEVAALVESVVETVRQVHVDSDTIRRQVAGLIDDYVAKQTRSLRARVRRLEGMVRPGDTGGAG